MGLTERLRIPDNIIDERSGQLSCELNETREFGLDRSPKYVINVTIQRCPSWAIIKPPRFPDGEGPIIKAVSPLRSLARLRKSRVV